MNDAPRRKKPFDARRERRAAPQAHEAPRPKAGRFDSEQSERADSSGPASFLPGVKPVLELLDSHPERIDAVFLRKGRHGKDLERIADDCRRAGVRFTLLDAPAFSRVYSGSCQGVVARLFAAGYVEPEALFEQVMDSPLPLILALDQVQDPGNAGTLARTMYALGGAGMLVPRHNGVYLGAIAAKAAAGALERLPVAKAANLGQALDAAKKQGFTIYGAAGVASSAAGADEAPAAGKKEGGGRAKTEAPLSLDVYHLEVRLPAILVLGSEESGMRQGLEKRCDYLVNIPMLREFDSLNVAQAGAIIIAAFAKGVFK